MTAKQRETQGKIEAIASLMGFLNRGSVDHGTLVEDAEALICSAILSIMGPPAGDYDDVTDVELENIGNGIIELIRERIAILRSTN